METVARSNPMFNHVKKKFKRKALYIVSLHAGLAVFMWFYMSYLGCPLKHFFGISCPSCGMGRAHVAFLHGDIIGAFAAHPLFWLAIPLVFLFLHNSVFNFHISKKVLNIIGTASITLLIVVYLLRVFVFHDPILAPDFEHSIIYRLFDFIK
jgi:hypothetical protein